jgi:hypothetical protein
MFNYWNWDAAVEDLQRAKLPQHTTTCRSDVELHWRVENEACSDTDKIVIDQQIEVLTSDEECQISFSMLQYIIYIDK